MDFTEALVTDYRSVSEVVWERDEVKKDNERLREDNASLRRQLDDLAGQLNIAISKLAQIGQIAR